MSERRYYPSTRDRLTRAFDEGVKSGTLGISYNPYKPAASGTPLWYAHLRGYQLSRGLEYRSLLPVVDLSAEFADLTAEIEAHPPMCLERGA